MMYFYIMGAVLAIGAFMYPKLIWEYNRREEAFPPNLIYFASLWFVALFWPLSIPMIVCYKAGVWYHNRKK